jgi:hypothetical protein
MRFRCSGRKAQVSCRAWWQPKPAGPSAQEQLQDLLERAGSSYGARTTTAQAGEIEAVVDQLARRLKAPRQAQQLQGRWVLEYTTEKSVHRWVTWNYRTNDKVPVVQPKQGSMPCCCPCSQHSASTSVHGFEALHQQVIL